MSSVTALTGCGRATCDVFGFALAIGIGFAILGAGETWAAPGLPPPPPANPLMGRSTRCASIGSGEGGATSASSRNKPKAISTPHQITSDTPTIAGSRCHGWSRSGSLRRPCSVISLIVLTPRRTADQFCWEAGLLTSGALLDAAFLLATPSHSARGSSGLLPLSFRLQWRGPRRYLTGFPHLPTNVSDSHRRKIRCQASVQVGCFPIGWQSLLA